MLVSVIPFKHRLDRPFVKQGYVSRGCFERFEQFDLHVGNL